MIIEIRLTLTRPWPTVTLRINSLWKALLMWEESNISLGICNIIHVFMFKRKKRSVMAQSISDWGWYALLDFFNIYICEKNIKPGISPSMNNFRGGIKWATLQVSHRCLSWDSLAFAAPQHEAPRILRWCCCLRQLKKRDYTSLIYIWLYRAM